MAKVENPRVKHDGMVRCKDCPMDDYECYNMAFEFSDGRICPTIETYAEASDLAAKAEKEAQG